MKLIKSLVGLSITFICIHSYANDFEPNGSIEFNQTFYGDAGSYKTATSHPSLSLNYNFSPEWSAALDWDRTWNMYNYDGGENQQDNSFSAPKITISYDYGLISDTKIKWDSSLLLKYENSFDHTSQTYTMAQTAFDFADYIPKGKNIQATQFAVSPMYIYGWNTSGPSGHVNTGVLSLLTNWQLPKNFSVTLNAYAFRDWYNGSGFTIDGENSSYNSANYFMVIALLNYSNQIYKFNDKSALEFNFTGGFDPWISSNRKAAWDPFLAGNQMYEWLTPTIMEGNYKSTYTLFALPQLSYTYQIDKSLALSVFAQAKYSNQVWGEKEKGWRVQPQGGFGLTYNF